MPNSNSRPGNGLPAGARGTVDIVSLSNALVLDPEGRSLQLGRLWQSKPAIFIFLRHFACIACRAHAVSVWNDREKYQKAGANLVFIGNGAPHYIAGFKETLGLQKALILTDPSLESFRAAGFRRGVKDVVQLKSVLNVIKLVAAGHRQTKLQAEGTHWQLGGVLAVSPLGKVTYHFASEALGDLPDQSDIETIVAEEEQLIRDDADWKRVDGDS